MLNKKPYLISLLVLLLGLLSHAHAADVNLTVEKSGNGTVTSEPTGINCGTNCTAPFLKDTTLKITANPDSGYAFTKWSGDCTGSSNPTYVIMNQNKTCTAHFELQPTQHYDLSVVKTAHGNITSVPQGIDCGSDCTEQFEQGTQITLIAQPTDESTFLGWGGDCNQSTAMTIVVALNAAMTCTANFKRNPIELTVAKSGNGNGIITSNPTGINCGTDCSASFDVDTTITLTAIPDAESELIKWTGDCTTNQNTPNSAQVTLTEAKSCSAEFKPLPHTLTVTKTGGEGSIESNIGDIDCGAKCIASYEDGVDVTLTATPAEDYELVGWIGECTGTETSATVTMNADKLCTANFGRQPQVLKVGSVNGTVKSDLAGIDCGEHCITSYQYETQILLTATPEIGYQFTGWHGDCVGLTPSTTVTINAAKTCTAHYALEPPEGFSNLTVVTMGGNGIIESEPEGLNCDSLCTVPYETDLAIRLTATPKADSLFQGWSEDCAGTDESTLITLDNQSVTCIAQFEQLPPDYTLTVTKAGTGEGTIISDLAGIDCGSQCKAPYQQNAIVTLTATPNDTSTFIGWSHHCSGAERTATVTLETAKTCTANFDKLPTYDLTLTNIGNGNGTVISNLEGINCGEGCTKYAQNAEVTLTANPEPDSRFLGWGNDCTGAGNPITITLDRDKTCKANFERLPTYQLTVTTTGDSTVERQPNGTTNCGEDCERYAQAEQVTLTATPATGAKFTGWAGDCSGTQTPLTITMNATMVCTANFEPLPIFGLSLKIAGDGTGSVNSQHDSQSQDCETSCTTPYYESTTVTLTATPKADSNFTGWSDDCTGTQPETTVTMDKPKTCTATFGKRPPSSLTITKAGTGTGTITAPAGLGNGLDCGNTCTESYSPNSDVTLTAVANKDSLFAGWSGECSGTNPALTITLDKNKTCQAHFNPLAPPGNYNLTLTKPENGLITSNQAGINCGTECSSHYPEGTTITLTATPNAGFIFTSWSGDCHSASPKTLVTMNATQICTANFYLQPPVGQHHLTVIKIGNGTVTSNLTGINCGATCTAAYPEGTTVTLTATAEAFSRFTDWEGDCVVSAANNAVATVTINQKAICTANFEALPSRIQFAIPYYQINEILGKAILSVTRAGSPQGTISVDYTTADGTALAGSDYTAATGTLKWDDGDMRPQPIEIFMHTDDIEEDDETLSVTLSNVTGGAQLGTNTQATLTITDTPLTGAGLLQFSASNYTVVEGENNVATLSVDRLGGKTGTVSISYETNYITAEANSDYTHRQGTLSWTSGEAQTKTIAVPILADDAPEAEETFTVSLFNPSSNADLGPNQTATINIIDSLGSPGTSSPGILQFTQSDYPVNDKSDNVTLTVSRTHGTHGQVAVSYTTQDGDAKADSDYVATSGILNWGDGEADNKNITVPIQADSEAEPEETFTVNLTNPSGKASLGALPTAMVKILDSMGTPVTPEPPSPGTLQFVADNYQRAENEGNLTISISRTGGDKGVVEVTYTTYTADDDTANYQDYIATQGTFRWLDGDSDNKSFKISLYDDGLVEGNETLSLKLEQPTGGAKLGTNNEVKLTILDNDATTIQLASNTYLVDEDSKNVTLTVTREGGRFGQVSVDYEIVADCQSSADNCATAGEDYSPIGKKTFTWVSGESGNRTITIPLQDDRDVEGNEILLVRLHNLTGNANFGEAIEATVTIVDNDTGECNPAPIMDCSWNNHGNTLQDIKIGPYGAIIGGQLSGQIQNEGVVQDITLLADTHLTGGFEMGKVRGNISGDPDSPAVLNYVEIAADTTLAHVVIGRSAIVNSGVVLKKGVRFESNGTIPYMADLNDVLGKIASPGLQIEAIKLTDDVLLSKRRDGILGAINGLYELTASRLVLKQNPDNGHLTLDVEPFHYTALPTQVQQVWGRQTISNQPLKPTSLTLDPNGELTFVTHTGRQVKAIPVVQDALALRETLSVFGLHELIMQPNGNLKVPADNGTYYMARPNLFSEAHEQWMPSGLNGTNSQWLDNLADLFLVFQASDNSETQTTGPQLRQQFMYSAPAYPDVFYALSETSNSQPTLYNDGRILAYIGRGINNKPYKGLFDYLVTPAQPPQDGKPQFQQIGDINGDGLNDYRITYPNGDTQVVYQCPACFDSHQ